VNWAKANNKIIKTKFNNDLNKLLWYGNEDILKEFEILGKYLGSGAESIVFENEKEDKVYKIMSDDGIGKNSWEIAKDKIVRHNRVFPETAYKVSYVVYSTSSFRYWPVLCQDVLSTDLEDYKDNSIDKFLRSKGFELMNKSNSPGKKVYKKGRTYVNDIHSGNIGKDKKGNYKVFDACLITKPNDFYNIDGEIFQKIKNN
jgi:hypothetical protein